MKLENQCCTLQQSKKLEYLGVAGKSAFYHHCDSGMKWRIVPEGYFNPDEEDIDFEPAFTVAELGVALPDLVEDPKGKSVVVSYRINPEYNYGKSDTDGTWVCEGMSNDNENPELHHTEAQVRAALLIYLLENNIITPASVNERLNAE